MTLESPQKYILLLQMYNLGLNIFSVIVLY